MESPLPVHNQIHNLDDTLEDGAWKDSFDKIVEPRPVLRQLQLLKRNVRASFNMDSSVENESSANIATDAITTIRKSNPKLRIISAKDNRIIPVSTPETKLVYKNPFKCSLSPVGIMKYASLKKPNSKSCGRKKSTLSTATMLPIIEDPKIREVIAFTATPVRHQLSDIVYDDLQSANQSYSFASKCANDTSSMLDFVFHEERKQRQVCFNLDNSSISIVGPQADNAVEKSLKEQNLQKTTTKTSTTVERPKSLTLQPGKWRKSLTLWKRTHNLTSNNRRSSIYIRPSEPGATTRKIRLSSLQPTDEHNSYFADILSGKCDWRSVVLKYCNQNEPLPFEMIYAADKLSNCRKLGEGAFGEVFLNRDNNNSNNIARNKNKNKKMDTVYKIIPIEGETEVNGEKQKKFDSIFPEIYMSIELCNLQSYVKNSTVNFVNIKKVTCIKGSYPQHLIELWEKYDDSKGSENDHPSLFKDNQLYIVLELSYSGIDMEAFEFQNAEQAYYALQQIILSLAIAEEAFKFEHRDLHWGNILIVNTGQKELISKFRNRCIILPTKGIKVTIIDYTLSRMDFADGCLYNDLSQDDELFSATGDYQFDIYRMMREVLNNNWQLYEPKTNIFWISYVISKLLNGVKYTSKRTKTHQQYTQKLLDLMDDILTYKSASECATFIFKLYN